jgi:ketosteroid isomerase-like protein
MPMLAGAEVREEVLLALGELRSAVSERRIEGVMSLFAPDADTTLIGSSAGEVARGPIELRAMLEEVFAGPATISWDWDEVHISSAGNVAWLSLEGMLVLDGTPDRGYRISGVLEQRSGRWLWTLFHGSEPS